MRRQVQLDLGALEPAPAALVAPIRAFATARSLLATAHRHTLPHDATKL